MVVAAAAVALTGCEGGQSPFAKQDGATTTAGAAATPASSVRLVDRDVEAPEVFSVTDQGLWDGRPSLGGVWVASAEAKDPERVIIRNPANGKFVIGALFRRERENPGPSIQISSDAAAALDMLAGQPAEVNITALRRDEAPTPVPDASQPILDAPETVAIEELDTAVVAAAIDEADGVLPVAEATTTDAEAATDAPLSAAPAELAPKKRRWWQRNAKADAVVAGAVATDEATTDAPLAAAGTAADTTITAAALPAPAAAAVQPAPVTGGKSLIQLGIFSVEENAQRAADMVTKAGSPATVRKEESKGKAYWSVVAGPATTPADRDALMKKVKGLGFADAYFVAR